MTSNLVFRVFDSFCFRLRFSLRLVCEPPPSPILNVRLLLYVDWFGGNDDVGGGGGKDDEGVYGLELESGGGRRDLVMLNNERM